MGIRGYHKYCKERVSNSHKSVNIMDSLEDFKIKSGKDPVVLINVGNFINIYQRSNLDALYGFRYNIIIRHFDAFLAKLKAANVQLIFPFNKSNLKLDMMYKEHVQKAEEQYKENCDVLDKIKEIKNVEKMVKHFAGDGGSSDFNFWFPYNKLLFSMLMNVAKKYGKVIGTSATPKMHYILRDHVALAEKHEVLAIIGFDSYYLIHGGNWKYWSANDLNFDTMDVSEYDREAVANHLGLSYDQMPLFVVLSGCDLLAEFFNKRIRYFFKPKDQFFKNISKFVLKRSWPLTNEDWQEMGDELFPESSDKAKNFIKFLMKAHETITWNESGEVKDELANLVVNNISNYAFEILTGHTISIRPYFVDYRQRDMFPFDEMILPLLLKTAGLLLHHKEDSDQKLNVLVKRSHEKSIDKEKLDLISPEFDVPDISLMLSGQLSDDEKLKLLSWILNLETDIDLLKEIPSDFLFIILTLNYLFQNKTLKRSEAIGILKTLVMEKKETIPDDIEYPETTDERSFRVSIIFIMFMKFLQNCASSIGFKDYEFEYKFDAVYYQKNFVTSAEETQELDSAEDNNAGRLKFLTKELKDAMDHH